MSKTWEEKHHLELYKIPIIVLYLCFPIPCLLPVVSENLFFHFCDKVTLCTRVLLLFSSPPFLVAPDIFFSLDMWGCPLQVDQGVAALVVLEQHVDVGGGKRTLITQVGDTWIKKKQDPREKR